MKSPVLCADKVGFRTLSGQTIVHDVSLEVMAGDRLAIIGPNGAGKTTLLQMLSGMLPASTGRITLDGDPIGRMRGAERARQIAVVGQSDQPDRRVTLGDYVQLGRIPHGNRMSRRDEAGLIAHVLDQTGLASLARREMGSLSGGERQRAQIARALAQQPRILFLDEPTNHLDPGARGMLLGLVSALDLTVVAVLHDLNLVPGFATEVAIIDQGRLIACAPPDEALSRTRVREVFGIEVLRIPHPHENRDVTVFDIPFTANTGMRYP